MRHLRVTLKVELMAGADIRDACCDMCELANRVGCVIEAKFNDVIVMAHIDDNPLKLVDAYHAAQESGRGVKIARC